MCTNRHEFSRITPSPSSFERIRANSCRFVFRIFEHARAARNRAQLFSDKNGTEEPLGSVGTLIKTRRAPRDGLPHPLPRLLPPSEPRTLPRPRDEMNSHHPNAQKRILEIFTQWKPPANFKIELFVVRVGDWGGYMLLDCDDPAEVHKFCSTFPAFHCEVRPVIPVMEAVRVELEAIAWRDGLKSK
jgi:hypothetical protein